MARHNKVLFYALSIFAICIIICLIIITLNYRHIGFDIKEHNIEREITFSNIDELHNINYENGVYHIMADDAFLIINAGTNIKFINNICFRVESVSKPLPGELILSDRASFAKNEAFTFKLSQGKNVYNFPYFSNTQYIKMAFEEMSSQHVEFRSIVVNDQDVLTRKIISECIVAVLFTIIIGLSIAYRDRIKTAIEILKKSRRYQNLRDVTDKKLFTFLFCGMLGAMFFIKIFGIAVLDVTYTDWLMRGHNDLTQHFMGWRFFRNSDWFFPIGLMDTISYPLKTSIVYVDAIPLFAVFFKLLSPVLPESFQYFGLFGIIIYFLQGAIAGLLIKRLCNNTLYSIIGSVFFALSVGMAHRMFAHTALTAHFILLLCIYACITKRDSQRNVLSKTVIWGGLSVLAVVIHMYFLPAVLLFAFFDTLDDCLIDKKIIKPLISILPSFAIMIFVMYIIGFFYGDTDKEAVGLGIWSANIRTLFNPSRDVSNYLRALPMASEDDPSYFGLGMILAFFLCIVGLIQKTADKSTKLKEMLLSRRFILCCLMLICFLILAASPAVTYGSRILFTYQLGPLRRIWNLIRATDRFIWTPFYVFMLAAIFFLWKMYKPKVAILVLAILLLVQIADLRDFNNTRGGVVVNKGTWQTDMSSDEWHRLGEQYDHIFHLYGYFSVWSIDDFAASNNMTVSEFHFSRGDSDSIYINRVEEIERILNGEINENTIYILPPGSEEGYSFVDGFAIYEIDDILIGLKER